MKAWKTALLGALVLILALCFALAIACGDDDDDDDDNDESDEMDDDLDDDTDDDADDDVIECGEGELWDEELDECIPEECGLDRYPDAPFDNKAIIYVDISFTGDSDGSAEKPYKTIQEAIANVGENTSILIAAGDYLETDTLQIELDGVDLVGRCSYLTKTKSEDGFTTLRVYGTDSNLINGIAFYADDDSELTFPMITLSETSKTEFSDNSVTDSGGSGLSANSCDGILISNSEIKNNTDYGIFFTLTNGTISGNQIHETKLNEQGEHGRGIFVGYSENISISGNNVHDNVGRGIGVENSLQVTVSDNSVESNKGIGVFFNDVSGTIKGNQIRDTFPNEEGAFGRGISVQYSEQISVSENSLEGNTDTGIFFAFASGTILGNEVRDNGYYGIVVQNSNQVSVSDNIVSGNTGSGIKFNNVSGTISNNEVCDTKPANQEEFSWGIGVENSSQVTVSGNIVERNSQVGILFGNASGTISENEVRDTKPDGQERGGWGIEIDQSGQAMEQVLVLDNIVEGNTEVGIALFNTTGTISGNQVRDTKPDELGEAGRGINIENSEQVSVANNNLEGNTEIGIFFAYTTGTISLNEVRNTNPDEQGKHGDGIVAMESEQVSVSDNTLEYNTSSGIFFDNVSGTISGNMVSDTLPGAPNDEGYTFGHGLHVQESTDVECSYNIVEDNLHAGIFFINTVNGNIQENQVSGTMTESRDTTDRGDGIIVLDTEGYITIQDNTLDGNDRCGILADSSTGMIERNGIFGNENSIVAQNESVMDVNDNDIHDNDIDIVQFFEGRELPVNDSMIERNGMMGQ